MKGLELYVLWMNHNSRMLQTMPCISKSENTNLNVEMNIIGVQFSLSPVIERKKRGMNMTTFLSCMHGKNKEFSQFWHRFGLNPNPWGDVKVNLATQ